MGANTKIEWATHSWSPWIGCSKAHTGCANCYAEAQAGRYNVRWGPNGKRRRTSDTYWKKPLTWERAAARGGPLNNRERPRVFPSLCDPFEAWKGPIKHHTGAQLTTTGAGDYYPGEVGPKDRLRLATLDDLRGDLFRLIDQTPHLDWLLLTKRPENVRRMWPGGAPPVELPGGGMREVEIDGGRFVDVYRCNVWLLYSASDQATLDPGLPHLLACRDLCPVLGLSLEPLLGPVDLRLGAPDACRPDWVIVGGESGPNARPCNIAHVRSIVKQCEAAQVACFVKQVGSRPFEGELRRTAVHMPGDMFWAPSGDAYHLESGKWLRLRHPKGGDPAEWPEDVRVRQLPEVER